MGRVPPFPPSLLPSTSVGVSTAARRDESRNSRERDQHDQRTKHVRARMNAVAQAHSLLPVDDLRRYGDYHRRQRRHDDQRRCDIQACYLVKVPLEIVCKVTVPGGAINAS